MSNKSEATWHGPPLAFNINGSLDLSEWVDEYVKGNLDEKLRPVLLQWLRDHGQEYLMEKRLGRDS